MLLSESYHVMNKDSIVAEIQCRVEHSEESFEIVRTFDKLPYNIYPVTKWIESRKIAEHHRQLNALMKQCGCDTLLGLISTTHCTSLTDTFWVKSVDSKLQWKDVSLYTNSFDENIARIAFDGTGLYGQQFTSTTPEFGTDGSFEKCWIRDCDNDIYLLKRGTDGFANSGLEPYSEALYSQIAKCFDIDFVSYDLIKHHDKLASKCKLFTSEDRSYVPMAYYAKDVYPLTNLYRLYDELGYGNFFYSMLVLDALTLNCDRHLGNFGWLVDSRTLDILSPAPLFDYNLACLPYIMKTDNVTDYINEHCGPSIGTDFAQVAKSFLTPELRATLRNLKSFEYSNPGFDFPEWRVKMLNDIKDQMIKDILQ